MVEAAVAAIRDELNMLAAQVVRLGEGMDLRAGRDEVANLRREADEAVRTMKQRVESLEQHAGGQGGPGGPGGP